MAAVPQQTEDTLAGISAGDVEKQSARPESQAAPAPASRPAAAGMSQDTIGQLKQLGEPHEQGVLTDQEFDQQKAKLLGA